MQEFIAERNNGTTTTTAVDQALMKTFKDASAIDLAIQAGIVNEGEIVSTIEDDRPHTLPIDQLRALQEDVRQLQEEQGSGVSDKISTTATSSDRCPAASEVTSEISSAISAEATARDTAICNAISAEVTNRNDAISAAITTEVDNRNTAITNAINGLDVAAAGGAGKYIQAISETDGKISATEGTVDTTVTASSDNLITSGAVNSALSASETALQGNINTVNAKISSIASSSDKVPAMSEVTSAISAEATARGTAITNAINALDVSDTAEANKYVSSVSETNGKISVTRASLPAIATFTLSGTDLIITY